MSDGLTRLCQSIRHIEARARLSMAKAILCTVRLVGRMVAARASECTQTMMISFYQAGVTGRFAIGRLSFHRTDRTSGGQVGG